MASIVGNAVDALIGVEVVHGVVHADGALVVAVPRAANAVADLIVDAAA